MNEGERKALLKAWRMEQQAKVRAAFPLPAHELIALFARLAEELAGVGCDNTRSLTRAWLESRGHDVDPTFAWLDEHGGFCDCEVAANVPQHVEEALKQGW